MGRILVIRGGAIGDFILTLPALKLLREAFPDAHIEILGYKHIVALAEGRFYAQATRSIEYGPMSSFFSRGAELPGDLAQYFGSFHQVISYLFDPDEIFADNLRRAGVKNLIVGSSKVNDEEHAARQLARPLEKLALFLEQDAASVHPSAADRAAAAALLAGLGGPLLALHPGSGGERKNWPVEKWMELGDALLAENPEKTLLVVGGEAEQERLAILQKKWDGKRVRFIENLPLPELAALFASCAIFVGHDSGISHLAASLGTRCLLLFGPTDPAIWAPTGPHVRILHSPTGHVSDIAVPEVRAALETWLKERRLPTMSRASRE